MEDGFHNIGCVYWNKSDGITIPISKTLNRLGFRTTSFLYNEKIPSGVDIIFACGPYESMVPLTRQLIDLPMKSRPLFVFWQSEQFPNPQLPEWINYPISVLRSDIEKRLYPSDNHLNGNSQILNFIISKGHRYRYYGDLFWWQRENVLSSLVVGSKWTVELLRQRGFDPILAYYGWHEGFGSDLGIERDIPVLWFGKVGTKRRKKILDRVRYELKERGIDLLMIDGIDHPYIFGEERTRILSRTKIVLNVLREQWDSNSMRYYIAAPNRALIITEPTLPHTAFEDRVHLVESPIAQLADTICYYLAHEELRMKIVDRAFSFVTEELTLENSIKKIMNQVLL